MHVFGGDLNKWSILRAYPGQERKVSLTLSRKRIDSFCPVFSKKLALPSRKTLVNTPLFPTYVFVKMTPDQHDKVLSVKGVEGFLFALGKRASVSEETVKLLERLLQENRVVHVTKTKVDFFATESYQFRERTHTTTKLAVSTYSFDVTFPSLGFSLLMESDSMFREPSYIPHFHVQEQRI